MFFDCFMDAMMALKLLMEAFPEGRNTLWKCQHCGLWLGALDLEGGLTAGASFDYRLELEDDPYFGTVLRNVELALADPWVRDRHEKKCDRCGVVNRRRRRG